MNSCTLIHCITCTLSSNHSCFHNLISQITNKRGPSILFYDWIINSVDTKLIFLSGTPIINEPSEIAYLFNMLKGKIDVYDFVLNTNGDVDEITTKLKEIFYGKISCIEQLNVKKYKGKIVVSIIKTNTNFNLFIAGKLAYYLQTQCKIWVATKNEWHLRETCICPQK